MINSEIFNEIGEDLNKKDFDNALKKLYQLLDIYPDNIKVISEISNIYILLNKFDKAIKFCLNYVHKNIFSEVILNNIALSYKKNNNYRRSLLYYKKSLKLNKDQYLILYNLGNLYSEISYFEKAKKCYLLCIKNNPIFIPPYVNISIIFSKQNNYKLSLKYLKYGLKLDNNNVNILENLAKVFLSLKDYKSAEIFFLRAVKQSPELYSKLNSVLLGYCYEGENEKYKNLSEIYVEKISNKRKIFRFNNNKLKKNNKIAFISPDIRNHPIGYFLKDLIPELSKHLDINIYSTSPYEDEITKFVQEKVDWKVCHQKNNEELADLIFKDNNNILFDMSGFAPMNRLGVFKLKPCKIQASWAGWLASTGLKEMDYIIGDCFATPKKDFKNFIEKVYMLPNAWCAYSKSTIHQNPLNKSNNEEIIFGCFQRPEKLNFNVLNAWREILKSTPNSYLKFNNKCYSNFDEKKIKRFFMKLGIEANRIIFHRCKSRKDYLDSFCDIDIYLDTFPYNGGTTSFEAAHFGLPILTMKNDSIMFRCGESINYNLGHNDWVASDVKDYIDIGIKYSKDKDLQTFKNEASRNINREKLFNMDIFSSNFVKMIDKISS